MTLTRLDLLLLVMVFIWGSNYSVIKSALSHIPPIAFNGVRLMLASALFAVALAARRSRPPSLRPSDDPSILTSPHLWALSLVGHTAYQLLFIEALDRTSVANSSLIIGCTPVFVALMTAALGHERIAPIRWAGVALSAAGIYLVVGHGAAVTGDSIAGDLLMLCAVFCWSAATIISRPLLARESPLTVTGYSMAIGTLVYLPFAWPQLRAVTWTDLGISVWMALVYSGLLALCVAYMIWYTALQRLGNTRTAVYSNLVPVAALVVAWSGYGNPVGAVKIAGAAAILAGVFFARR